MNDRDLVQEASTLRVGSVLAVLGGFAYMTATLWHGDLPDETTGIALMHIAGRSEWQFVHLLAVIAVLLWVGAFVTLSTSLSSRLSRLLGQMATLAIGIGTALFIVDYAIDGYALKQVADRWHAASAGPEKQELLLVAETMLGILDGTFRFFIAWLYGLPFVLLGLAVAFSVEYRRWLGWVAVVAGAGAMTAGTTLFLDLDLVPFPLLFGGFVLLLNVWLVVMGVLTWRRAGRLPSAGGRGQGAAVRGPASKATPA